MAIHNYPKQIVPPFGKDDIKDIVQDGITNGDIVIPAGETGTKLYLHEFKSSTNRVIKVISLDKENKSISEPTGIKYYQWMEWVGKQLSVSLDDNKSFSGFSTSGAPNSPSIVFVHFNQSSSSTYNDLSIEISSSYSLPDTVTEL